MLSGYEGYASVGHEYALTCEYTTDDPAAQLTWYKDNIPLDCDNSNTCTVSEAEDGKTTIRFVITTIHQVCVITDNSDNY